MEFSMKGQEKKVTFNSGGCLIEVTTWARLTVLCFLKDSHSKITTNVNLRRYTVF
jgi:hypothetical protein